MSVLVAAFLNVCVKPARDLIKEKKSKKMPVLKGV